MIFKVIFEVIDFAFVILEAPYVLIMSYFLYYEKCEFIYVWLPVEGAVSIWINDLTDKVEYSIDGHILIRKLFKK